MDEIREKGLSGEEVYNRGAYCHTSPPQDDGTKIKKLCAPLTA